MKNKKRYGALIGLMAITMVGCGEKQTAQTSATVAESQVVEEQEGTTEETTTASDSSVEESDSTTATTETASTDNTDNSNEATPYAREDEQGMTPDEIYEKRQQEMQDYFNGDMTEEERTAFENSGESTEDREKRSEAEWNNGINPETGEPWQSGDIISSGDAGDGTEANLYYLDLK